MNEKFILLLDQNMFPNNKLCVHRVNEQKPLKLRTRIQCEIKFKGINAVNETTIKNHVTMKCELAGGREE